MKDIVEKLTELGKTIATMESCTGGYIANEITNVEGASNILKFSAVTYSNEYKVKLGVSASTIDKYSVYSAEVAKEMAKTISDYADASFGVGVTGKFNKPDPNNNFGDDNKVYICIYDKDNNKYYDKSIVVSKVSRIENKKEILDKVIIILKKII